MGRGVNKAFLLGNCGNNPLTHQFPDGNKITTISLATSDSWTDKLSGEKQERTEWHTVVFKKRLAEIAERYLHKGSKIYIEGKLNTKNWEGNNGKTETKTEIIALSLEMLGGQCGDEENNCTNKSPTSSKPTI